MKLFDKIVSRILPTQSKPTQADLVAASDKTLADVIAPKLRILFCGINPGLYSAYTGHHFARPGNRFWPTLYRAGFTPRLLKPAEQQELLAYGYGITNVVERASATAAELTTAELEAGGAHLLAKVEKYQPAVLAVLGVTAYRAAFRQPKAQMGEQATGVGSARLWILPNPSGLNAHYTLPALAEVFREFRLAVEGG